MISGMISGCVPFIDIAPQKMIIWSWTKNCSWQIFGYSLTKDTICIQHDIWSVEYGYRKTLRVGVWRARIKLWSSNIIQLWRYGKIVTNVCQGSDKDSLAISLYLNCSRTKLASMHFVSFAKMVVTARPKESCREYKILKN